MIDQKRTASSETPKTAGRSAVAPNASREYRSPRLTRYGSISKLTQSGAGSGADGGSTAGMMMSCL